MQRFGIDLLGASPAGCPFGHDTQRTPKALHLQTAPEFGTVAATCRPLLVKPWQMGFQRCFSRSEDVAALAAQNPPHQASAVASAPHDLLDGDALFGKGSDRSVGVFPMEIALVLKALGGGEQSGVDGHRTNCATNLPHRLAYRI